MSLFNDKNKIAGYFRYMPWQIVETAGIREGLILKFGTYYMKIYNGDSQGEYLVEVYHYGCDIPYRRDYVPFNEMRDYAAKFGE